MGKKVIYFVFTDTGTNLSRIINYCTRQSLNHVSIGFDDQLKELYSFGRTQPKNPFSGGFVREDIKSDFLKDASCAIYAYHTTEEEYERVLSNIKQIESIQHHYRYNFIGLIGVLFRIQIKRKNAFFCSEFVATMLQDAESIQLSKPSYFVTPADIRAEISMNLIYEGKLGNYQTEMDQQQAKKRNSLEKQSFIFILSKKVKQFVVR